MCKQKMMVVALLLVVFLIVPGVAVADDGATDSPSDDDRRSWTVAVIADLNGSYGSTQYNEHVKAAVKWLREDLKPDLVVVAGDMVAGQQEGLDYPAMWDAFHRVVTDELAEAGIPMAVTPGNHDASEQPAFWEERIEFAAQWEGRQPRLQFVDDSFYPFYYAFELGPALFISLDGTGVGDLDEGQRAWVEKTLRENSHLELSFVTSHVPQYAVAEGRQHEVFADEELAEIFSKYGVDMMISGHHHAYYPAKRDETVFLHASALGSGVRQLLGERERRPRNVAVVRFDEKGIDKVEAFESPDFVDIVDDESLPESLGDGDLQIWRHDLDEPPQKPDEPES